MRKLLTLVSALAALAAWANPGMAQQMGAENATHSPDMEQEAEVQRITGEVTKVDPTANAFTVEGDDLEVTFSNRGTLPEPGQIVSLTVICWCVEEGVAMAPITVNEEGVRRIPITVQEEGVRRIPITVEEEGIRRAPVTIKEEGVRGAGVTLNEPGVGSTTVTGVVKNQTRTGTVISYDPALQSGRYREDGTGLDREFDVTRPTIRVSPGDSVEILHRTPGGKVIDILIKVNGGDV